MDQLSNTAALYIAHSLVNSFSLQQASSDIDTFIDSVSEASSLSSEQRNDLLKLLHKQFNYFRPGILLQLFLLSSLHLPPPPSSSLSPPSLLLLTSTKIVLGKYEITRIAVTELLSAINYPAFLKLLDSRPDGPETVTKMRR